MKMSTCIMVKLSSEVPLSFTAGADINQLVNARYCKKRMTSP